MDIKTRFVTSGAISEIQQKPHLLKSTLWHAYNPGSDRHTIK